MLPITVVPSSAQYKYKVILSADTQTLKIIALYRILFGYKYVYLYCQLWAITLIRAENVRESSVNARRPELSREHGQASSLN